MLLFLTVFTLSANSIVTKPIKTDKKQIEKTIRLFMESGDERSIEKSDQSLHKDFSQYLNYMGKGVSRSTKEQYEMMLKKGQIGGDNRSLKVSSIDIIDDIAYAKVIIKSSKLVFHDLFTLMKEDGEWKIVTLTLRVTLNK